MVLKLRFCLLAAFVMTVGWLSSESLWVPSLFAADKQNATKPVESDMHEFMEYYFQPTFKRLQPAMASAPVNNAGWKTIKADSLILAEGGNLLLSRLPEEDVSDWVSQSTQVREFGQKLYQAAKSKDYATARKHYESMVQNCNACHQQFAGGEHILKP